MSHGEPRHYKGPEPCKEHSLLYFSTRINVNAHLKISINLQHILKLSIVWYSIHVKDLSFKVLAGKLSGC